mmetsp:Transcript_15130/g.43015  ORF Transcript_15130/g.43015 Transcript_15130/m.43015 type:complete len:337 (+) Transcript_15130:1181-2191(+)
MKEHLIHQSAIRSLSTELHDAHGDIVGPLLLREPEPVRLCAEVRCGAHQIVSMLVNHFHRPLARNKFPDAIRGQDDECVVPAQLVYDVFALGSYPDRLGDTVAETSRESRPGIIAVLHPQSRRIPVTFHLVRPYFAERFVALHLRQGQHARPGLLNTLHLAINKRCLVPAELLGRHAAAVSHSQHTPRVTHVAHNKLGPVHVHNACGRARQTIVKKTLVKLRVHLEQSVVYRGWRVGPQCCRILRHDLRQLALAEKGRLCAAFAVTVENGKQVVIPAADQVGFYQHRVLVGLERLVRIVATLRHTRVRDLILPGLHHASRLVPILLLLRHTLILVK